MIFKHNNWRVFLALAFLLGAVTGLNGCSNPAWVYTESGPTSTYLFHHSPLTAIDPDDPVNSTAIHPPGTDTADVTPIQHADYYPLARMIFDRHIRTIIYRLPATGEWWKVSALKRDGLLPTRLSNETAATAICGAPVQKPDYMNHENARFVYRLPGTDAACNTADDVWKMLKAGMSASDSPVAAYSPVAAIHDIQNGALTGWLAKNGNSLFAYDAEFANPVLLANFATNAVQTAVGPGGIVFLTIDDKLHAYNPNTSPATLSAPLHTVAASLVSAVTDESHLYFGDQTSIYQVPLDGSGSANLMVTDATGSIYSIVLTDTRVVYTNWTGGQLRSVPKAGGAVTDLGATWSLTGAAGSRIYFNTLVFGTPWIHTAHVIDDDGTNGLTYPAAAWTPVQQNWGYFGATGNSLPLGRMILRENADAAPFTLNSYDPVTHTLVASLGTLPADLTGFTNFQFTRLPNKDNILVQAYSYVNNSYDVLLLNTSTTDSLTRLTDTTADNEALVGPAGCSISGQADFDPLFLFLLLLALIGCRLKQKPRDRMV